MTDALDRAGADVITVDFTTMAEGTVTRKGRYVARCPECGKLGERKRVKLGRRQVVHLHRARYIHTAKGKWTITERLDQCAKTWETTTADQGDLFGGRGKR